MRHLGSFRMYESVIRELAVRGHDIHLALGRGAWLARGLRPALESLLEDHPRVTWSRLSPSMSPFWSDVARTIRLWVDYLRYFLPEYDATPKLKARAAELEAAVPNDPPVGGAVLSAGIRRHPQAKRVRRSVCRRN